MIALTLVWPYLSILVLVLHVVVLSLIAFGIIWLCGCDFNQSLDIVPLPSCLQSLTVGDYFNPSLAKGMLTAPRVHLWLSTRTVDMHTTRPAAVFVWADNAAHVLHGRSG